MLQASKNNDVVSVYVSLTDTPGVYGTAFEVAFDTAGAAYLGYTRGTAMEASGGAPAYTVDGSTNPGRIVVGVARTNGTTTNIVGSKAVLQLQFRVKQAGAFPVTLQNGIVYDGQVPPKPIPTVQWFAGALTGA
jgi:phage baseplate assembly protein gpV